MNKKTLNKFATVFFAASIFISCSHNQKSNDSYYRILISVQDGIKITADEAREILYKKIKQNRKSQNLAEIIIYSHSSGKETFFYSKDSNDNIKRDNHQGSIKILLKIREDNKLTDVYFFQATGNSKVELIEKIAFEVRKVLY